MRKAYYGYLVFEDWLWRRGLAKKLGSEDSRKDKETTVVNAINNIARESGFYLRMQYVTVWIRKGEIEGCFAIASNDPADQLPMPTPERIQRLKDVIGTDREPRWWYYA